MVIVAMILIHSFSWLAIQRVATEKRQHDEHTLALMQLVQIEMLVHTSHNPRWGELRKHTIHPSSFFLRTHTLPLWQTLTQFIAQKNQAATLYTLRSLNQSAQKHINDEREQQIEQHHWWAQVITWVGGMLCASLLALAINAMYQIKRHIER